MLVISIIQTIASVLLSLTGITLAYFVYKIQHDRNTAKLVLVCDELLEDDEHEEPCSAIRILNVGLVPAVNVKFLIDIEEWQEGRKIRSRFHERYFAFEDTIPLLSPQDSRLYELPTPENKSYLFTAVATCRHGTGDEARYLQLGNSTVVASDRIAFRQVKEGRAAAIRRLKPRKRNSESAEYPIFMMGASSMKDYNELFGDDKT